MIEDGSGQNEGAAHDKIGEVTDECRGSAFDKQLDNHFQKFCDDAGHRAQIEGADQDGDFAQIQLIEGRGEKQGDLKVHENAAQSSGHGNKSDVTGLGRAVQVGMDQPFGELGHGHQSGEDQQAHQQKGDVFGCGLQEFFHRDHLV